MGDSPAKAVILKKFFRIQPTKLAKHLDETLKFNKVSKSMQAFSLLPQNVTHLFKLNSDCLKIIRDKSWVVPINQDLKCVLELQLRPDAVDTFENVECTSKDIMCTIKRSFADINEYPDMAYQYLEKACQYLKKIKECERLKTELSKSTKHKSDKDFAN
ncbi:hypothetical protein Tco_0276906 [Tanacetum coccineum]